MGKMKELFLEEQQLQMEALPALNNMIHALAEENKEYDNLLQVIAINYSKLIDDESRYTNTDFFVDLDYILERYQKTK